MRTRSGMPYAVLALISFATAVSLPFIERGESYAEVTWAPNDVSDGGAAPVQAGYFDKLLISERAESSSARAESGTLVDFGSWMLVAEGDYLRAQNTSSEVQATTDERTIFGPFLCPTPCAVEVRAYVGNSTVYWSHNAEVMGTTEVEGWIPRVQSFIAHPITIERGVEVIGHTVTTSYTDSPLRLVLIALVVVGLSVSLIGFAQASTGLLRK
jgi:hypothetical protein